jgi:hypothetical protein
MYLSNNQKIIALIVVIASMLLHTLAFLPFLKRRESTHILTSLLSHWENGHYDKASTYWIDPNDSPAIDSLYTYEIIAKSFGKKNGRPFALFIVRLDFLSGSKLPSNKAWKVEITHTKHYNWKVTDFRRSQ